MKLIIEFLKSIYLSLIKKKGDTYIFAESITIITVDSTNTEINSHFHN